MNPLDFLAGATSIQGLATAAPEVFRRGFIVGVGLLLVIAGLVFVVSGTKAGQVAGGLVTTLAMPGGAVAKVAGGAAAGVAKGAAKGAGAAKTAAAAAKGA